jgi:RNA polymerase sigma factor (sigma-70 family)
VNASLEGTIGSATDPALVDRARLGDLDAFEEIVRDHMDAVYRLSFAILGDESDARDAAQETFVSAWRQIRGLRDVERFDAWLQRVAVNAARMAHRARRRRGVREIPASQVEAMADRAARSDGDRLGAALKTLAVDQRAILTFHHLDGRTVAEIAGILEIPVGTVKSRLFAARRALQAALDTDGDDR